MDAGAIQNVTVAIQQRLVGVVGEKVFVGPLHDEGAKDARLVLFLYRVVPNADLRNTPHVLPDPTRPEGRVVHDNAVALDLHYVLTAGGQQDGGEVESLARLGLAMQALNDRPVLGGTDLRHETVRLTVYPGSSDELGRVWALFPDQNYRTSVLYLATPVWIDPAWPAEEAPPVVETPFRVGPPAVEQRV